MGTRRSTDGRRPAGVAADPARRVAFDVLRAVDERDAYANLLLPKLLRERGLDGRDAAFATEVCYGTLRALGTYDAVLGACSSRPLHQIEPVARDVLRLGVHQLLATRVPPHAAVSTAVDLARDVAGHRFGGFVNAVLRQVSRRDYDGWVRELAPRYHEDPLGHLAFAHAHPRWIVEVYRDALDGDLDETAAVCRAGNMPPVVHLAARPGRISRDELLDEVGADGEASRWSPYGVYLSGGDPARLESVRAARAGVQDEGSQLAAVALDAAPLAGSDRRWLDLCAGPGGKAALLAGLVETRGGVLLAADHAAHRARLTAAALRGTRSLVVTADGTRPAWRAASFDRVLVDAPCTGLGALRRRPEARWRRSPVDAERLHPLQVALLTEGLRVVRPGGLVAYVTCSPHPWETVGVVADVRARRPDVCEVAVQGLLPGMPDLAARTHAQLWPHRHGTDAMFISVLRREHNDQ